MMKEEEEEERKENESRCKSLQLAGYYNNVVTSQNDYKTSTTHDMADYMPISDCSLPTA